MALQILVIEDNLSFLVELRVQLEDLDVSIDSENTKEGAILYLSENKPDLVLLDNMLGNSESGALLAERLSQLDIPFVVVTNSKDEKVFEEIVQFKPLAYYTKPLDTISLRYLISRLLKRSHNQVKDLKRDNEHIFVKWRSEVVRIPHKDILFIEGEGNYITLNTKANKKFVLRRSLKMVSQQLPQDSFIRVHRNYIVNINTITTYSIKENTITIGEIIIPVGRTFKSIFKKNLPI